MSRLRSLIVPGMGYAIILMMIAHRVIPGGLVSPPPPSPGGTSQQPPEWSYPILYLLVPLAFPWAYPLINRLDDWVSGRPRR